MDRETRFHDSGLYRGPSSASVPLPTDQRKFHRMKMIMGMLCHRSQGTPANVFTDDVSLGGIKFTSSVPMDRGEDVELDVPTGGGRYKRIRGKIAWFRKGVGKNYEGGIEFGRMDEETRKEWNKFIERNAEREKS